MEEILRRYSPGMTPENTGEQFLQAPRSIPVKPQKRLDLHGSFVEEALNQVRWFVRESAGQGLVKVQVITGQGKGTPSGFSILFLEVKKLLQQLRAKRKIHSYEEKPGHFDIILPT